MLHIRPNRSKYTYFRCHAELSAASSCVGFLGALYCASRRAGEDPAARRASDRTGEEEIASAKCAN
jgi:hypothetical protein